MRWMVGEKAALFDSMRWGQVVQVVNVAAAPNGVQVLVEVLRSDGQRRTVRANAESVGRFH